MPDQKICPTGQRTAGLQEFDDLPASWFHKSSPGLRASSLLNSERCEFSRLSSAYLAKDFDVKPSLCADGGIVEASLNVLLATSQSCPWAEKQTVVAAAAAAPPAAADDSGSKVSATSRKIALPRGRPFKTVRSGALLESVACAVVKSLEENGETVRSAGRKKAQSRLSKATKLENDEIASESPRPRGVRIRPGVKGFLVEIRPRRWKKTIWLGTYPTSPEAARAYDAGIFYTGKNIPFNFQESEGTFPPLPEHLSLANFDPRVMEQIKWFVKEQAQKAAKRGEVLTQGTVVAVPQTCNTSNNEGRRTRRISSVGSQSECTLFSGSKEAGGHVKDEDQDGCDLPPVTPNPFQNQEPLPYNLPPCSKQILCNNDRDFWGGRIPLTVHEYLLPQTSVVVGDEDLLNITQQISCLTQQSSSNPWPHDDQEQWKGEEAGFQSAFGSKRDRNLGILSLDSQGVQSFDLGVWDTSSGDGLSLLDFEGCDPCACPQVRKFLDSNFAMTHPEDALVLHPSLENTSSMSSSMSSCMDSTCLSIEESTDDDEIPVWLWPHVHGRG